MENPFGSVDKSLINRFFDLQNISNNDFYFVIINQSYIIPLLEDDLDGFKKNEKNIIINELLNQLSSINEINDHENLNSRSILVSLSEYFENQIKFYDSEILKLKHDDNINFSFIIDTDDFSKYLKKSSKFFDLMDAISLVSLISKDKLDTRMFISAKHKSNYKLSNYSSFKLYKI